MSATNGSPGGQRAAIYARVSSGRQEQEETVQNQLADVRAYAARQGYTIVTEYVDEAYSGNILQRPRLDAMRQAARNHEFDRLLVWKIDRLARGEDASVLLLLLSEVRKQGVQVETPQGPLGTSPQDTLLVTMLAAIAGYERVNIVERIMSGKMRRAREGAVIGGYIPYGYRYVPRNGPAPARLIVHPEQAAVVRRMFSWLVDEGLSCRAIAVRLQGEGVATQRGGKLWRASTVNHMLHQELYAGTWHYHATEHFEPEHHRHEVPYRKNPKTARRLRPRQEWVPIPVPALIDRATFDAAQRRLQENSRFAPRNNKKHEYLLRGLVRCGQCGGAMVGAAGHGRRYYVCTRQDPANVGAEVCRAPRVEADEVEAQVWDEVATLMRNPELVEQEYQRRLAETGASDLLEARQRELESALTGIGSEFDRLLDIYQSAQITKPQWEERAERLNRRREAAERELARVEQERAERERVVQAKEGLDEFLADIRRGLAVIDFAGRQEFLRAVVREVMLTTNEDGLRIVIRTILPLPKARGGRNGGPFGEVGLRPVGRYPEIQRNAHRRFLPLPRTPAVAFCGVPMPQRSPPLLGHCYGRPRGLCGQGGVPSLHSPLRQGISSNYRGSHNGNSWAKSFWSRPSNARI